MQDALLLAAPISEGAVERESAEGASCRSFSQVSAHHTTKEMMQPCPIQSRLISLVALLVCCFCDSHGLQLRSLWVVPTAAVS